MPQPKFVRVWTALDKTNSEFKHFLTEGILEGFPYFSPPFAQNNCISWAAGSHDALEYLCLVILPGGVGINIDLELLLRDKIGISCSNLPQKNHGLLSRSFIGAGGCKISILPCYDKNNIGNTEQTLVQIRHSCSVCNIIDLVTSWENVTSIKT